MDFNHVDPKLLASGSDDAKGTLLVIIIYYIDMSVLPKNRQLVFPHETTSGIGVRYFKYPNE